MLLRVVDGEDGGGGGKGAGGKGERGPGAAGEGKVGTAQGMWFFSDAKVNSLTYRGETWNEGMPAGQYQFALLDTGGDGFCCQNGFGCYSLYANANGDVLVFSDGQFGGAKNETFSVGEFSGEAVTKSGTNGLRGSLLHRQRNHSD